MITVRLDPLQRRLAEGGIELTVGSNGDSHDNALAETINGLYKAELNRRPASWKTKAVVELATLEWAAWFNYHRLLFSIGGTKPPSLMFQSSHSGQT